MANEITIQTPEDVTGIPELFRDNKENSRRGTGKDDAFFDLAKEFIAKWPAGSKLKQTEFDKWVAQMGESDQFRNRAADIGLYVMPSNGDRNSAEYRDCVQRRTTLRGQMNNASTTSRMIEAVAAKTGNTGYAFKIDCPAAGHLVVNTAIDAFAEAADLHALARGIETERKTLRELQQSMAYYSLDSRNRDDIDDIAEKVARCQTDTVESLRRAHSDIRKSRVRLQQRMADALATPVQSAVKQIAAPAEVTEPAKPASPAKPVFWPPNGQAT